MSIWRDQLMREKRLEVDGSRFKRHLHVKTVKTGWVGTYSNTVESDLGSICVTKSGHPKSTSRWRHHVFLLLWMKICAAQEDDQLHDGSICERCLWELRCTRHRKYRLGAAMGPQRLQDHSKIQDSVEMVRLSFSSDITHFRKYVKRPQRKKAGWASRSHGV